MNEQNLAKNAAEQASRFPKDSSAPGEQFEVRNVSDSPDYEPDPSKSLKLSEPRQRLVDDIIALYSCQPTIERVNRYTPDCVYDDQFVYGNNRYKMAGQGFKESKNHGYQITVNEPLLIAFYNKQSWTFAGIPKTATINALVSLSLDPETADSDFPLIKYHKDQANEKDYSHSGLGFEVKKWQADHVMKNMDAPEVQHFKKDENAGTEPVKVYKSGVSEEVIDKKAA